MAGPSRRSLSPFTRTALLAFAWKHRHSIFRWGRSLWIELSSPMTIAPKRLATIARVLVAVTADSTIANSRHLRQVRLDGDTVILDVDPDWSRTNQLVDRLLDVKGVRQVTTERTLH
jgi:hypothetical protein